MMKMQCCALLVLVSLVNVSNAVEISSGTFTMRFGVTDNNPAVFNTNETSGTNTPNPSPGQFGFTYGFVSRNGTAYQGAASSDGATFVNGTFANGTPGNNEFSGWSPNFQFTVGANYLGAIPGGAVAGSEKIRINIDSISVYGMAHTAYQVPGDTLDMFFRETTVLNPGVSGSQTLPSSSSPTLTSSYAQLLWSNPNSFLEAGLGSNRTFVLDTINGYNFGTNAGARVIDGFVITGSATLVFDVPAPEPSSVVLLGLGLVGLSMKRRKQARPVVG